MINTNYKTLPKTQAYSYNKTEDNTGKKFEQSSYFTANSLNENLPYYKKVCFKGNMISLNVEETARVISQGKTEGILKTFQNFEELNAYKDDTPVIAIIEDVGNYLFEKKSNNKWTFKPKNLRFNKNVNGIIVKLEQFEKHKLENHCFSFLGHEKSRLRGRQIFAVLPEQSITEFRANVKEGSSIAINLCPPKKQGSKIKFLYKTLNYPPKIKPVNIKLDEVKLVPKILTLQDSKRLTPQTVGLKAYNLHRLNNIKSNLFSVPNFFVIPAGIIEYVKKFNNINEQYITNMYIKCLSELSTEDYPTALRNLQSIIINLSVIPEKLEKNILNNATKIVNSDYPDKNSNPHRALIVRSSFSDEDSASRPTQGLYTSIAGVKNKEQLFTAIKQVVASKYSDIAFNTRVDYSIPSEKVYANVIVQNMVPVDYGFTIYTKDPNSHDKNKIFIELTKGLDNSLPGNSYIFEYDKTTQKITKIQQADKKTYIDMESININTQYEKIVDYSKDPLSASKDKYSPIIKKIGSIAHYIERKFADGPLDIEGGIIFKKDKNGQDDVDVHIWQARQTFNPMS